MTEKTPRGKYDAKGRNMKDLVEGEEENEIGKLEGFNERLNQLEDYNPEEKGFKEIADDTETEPGSAMYSPDKTKATTLSESDKIDVEPTMSPLIQRELLDYVTDRKYDEIKAYISKQQVTPAMLRTKLDKGRTYLHYAMYRGKKDVTELLLESGSLADARDSSKRSALHYAVANNKIQVVQMLVEAGADINGRDADDRTPLHYALRGGYGEIMFKLLFMDAEANPVDKYGMHPLDYCIDKGSADALRSTFGGTNSELGRMKLMGRYVPNSLFDRRRDLLNTMQLELRKQKLEEKINHPEEQRHVSNITHNDFIIHDILGKGSFGEVYLVEKRNSKGLFAMKVFSKRVVQSQNLMRFIYIEKKIMHTIIHPFMVELHFAFQTDRKLYLVMDYCKNRDLGQQLKKKGTLSEQIARIVIAELILAVEAIHAKDIVHRDLKPDNILIDDDGHIKVTDFGLAKENMRKGVSTKTFCGSIAYLPPEIIKKAGHNKMVDWYLVGVILYELVCGKPPYFNKQFAQLSHNILHAKLAFPPGLSLNIMKFIKKMIHRDPNQRLGAKKGAEEIKKHDFFIGIDWDQVYRRELRPFNPAEVIPYKTNNYKQSIIDEVPGGVETVDMPNWSFCRQD